MGKLIGNNLDFNNVSKIVNLPNPTETQDAATKGYVDSIVEGLAWKDDVRVATVSNINLASPGATINGVSMSIGDRVLVMLQTASSQNGIYIWNGASTPMTRSLDASTATELEQAVVGVSEGTYANTTFRQTSVNFSLDTDDIEWVSFGTTVPDATENTKGIVELATLEEVNTGTDISKVITPATLNTWTGKLRKATAIIGDGSSTTFVLTHNFNSYDVVVSVFHNSGNRDDIIVDVKRTSVNEVTIDFITAPTSNQFKVLAMG